MMATDDGSLQSAMPLLSAGASIELRDKNNGDVLTHAAGNYRFGSRYLDLSNDDIPIHIA